MVPMSSSLMLPVMLLLMLTWVPYTESTTTKAGNVSNTSPSSASTANSVNTTSNPANTTSSPVVTTINPGNTTSTPGTTTSSPVPTTTNANNTNTTSNILSSSTTVAAKPTTNSTQAPAGTQTPSATTKSNTTATSTPKPNENSTDSSTTSSTRPSTSMPNTTTTVSSINTSAGGTGSTESSTVVTTTAQVTTQTSSVKPNVTTLNPNTTSSTQKPTTENPASSSTNSTGATTKPSTVPSTNNTTTMSSTSTQSQEVTTSTQKQTSSQSTSTVSQATTKSSSVNPTTTTVALAKTVFINEIMVDKDGGFQKIELQTMEEIDITHYVMVVVDGSTNKTMSTIYLKDMKQQQQSSPFFVVTFNTSRALPSLLPAGTGIAIYDTNMMTLDNDWTVSNMGLVDALVIGTTYSQISRHLTDVLTPGTNPFILDPTKYGSAKTISRCSSNLVRSTDMYAFINPSFGIDNTKKCEERLSKGSDFSVKLKIGCNDLTDERNRTFNVPILMVNDLITSVVRQVNMQCQCGVTSMHIQDPVIHCCDGPSVDMRFVAPNNDQVAELKESFEKFLQASTILVIKNHIYPIDNTCSENCCNVDKHPHPHTSDDDKAKNVKVTVAVIVTCLLVFMLVVLVVILYVKRKKSAVYQFRMSRLDEEDEFNVDGPDQEDFVGGQEATFDVKHR